MQNMIENMLKKGKNNRTSFDFIIFLGNYGQNVSFNEAGVDVIRL